MGEDMYVQKMMLASFTTLVVLCGLAVVVLGWLIV